MNENKLLRRSLAVYISNDLVIKKKLFKIHHDDSFSNHFARARTENAIRRKYFRSHILFENKQYVCICFDCQRVRVYYHKSYNKFNFISSSDGNLFYIIIMNIIIDMSSTRNLYINKICDVILILIDKLIKYSTYIAIIKKLNVKDFAKLFRRDFVLHHDMMRNIF